MRNFGFPPSIDKNTKIVIFGTFPGEDSLRKKQYYGHKQNQFWKLLSSVIDKDLVTMDYNDRLNTLLKHHIGIWDVIESCERKGSSDTEIVNEELNDFSRLRKYKSIKLLCFNGKNQEKYLKKHKNDLSKILPNIKTIALPSTSPAHALKSFKEKLEDWKEIKKCI